MAQGGRRTTLRVVAGLALSVGATAVTLLLAARAAAQARVEILPSIGVSESFSDNLDFSPDDERSGFTTNVTPRLRVGSVGGRLQGFAQYGLNLRYEHFSEGERPGVDHDASVSLDYAATPRWELSLREDFRVSPDPTQDLAFVTPEGRVFRTFEEAARTPGVDVLDLRSLRVREDQLRNRLSLGTTYELTPRWSAGADAIWIVQDSLDNVFVEDSQTYAARARTGYRLTPIDDVRLSVGYDYTQYDVSPDATVARVDVGWDRRLSETMRSELTAGYASVGTPDDDLAGDDADDDVPYASASLVGLLPQGQWRIRLAREVATGDGSGDVTRRDVAQVSASRALGPQLSAGGRLAYLQTRSVRGVGSEADTFEGTVSLSWRFVRWAAARAAYRYRYEEPIGTGRSIAENSGLIGLDILWPVREMVGLAPQ